MRVIYLTFLISKISRLLLEDFRSSYLSFPILNVHSNICWLTENMELSTALVQGFITQKKEVHDVDHILLTWNT